MDQTTAKRNSSRKPTCRAAVRRVLRERGVEAEELLVALLDVIVDSRVDRELRTRGLGPALIEAAPDYAPEDALTTVQRAVYDSEFVFGKGFGRRPARGTVADASAERAMRFDQEFVDRLSPMQPALRHVLGIGWEASVRFMDRVDPPVPEVSDQKSDVRCQRRMTPGL